MSETKSGNFFMVSNRIFELELTPVEFAVYCCLLRHMDLKKRTCYPSRSTIAYCCQITSRTVDKALKSLCDLGLIQKESRYRKDGKQQANLYTVSDLIGEPTSE